MNGREKLLLAASMFAAVLIVVIGITAMPWPGDVTLARATQALLPAGPGWAQWLSHTAEAPREFGVLVIVIALGAWWVSWRGGLLAIASFIGMWVLDKLLRLVIFQPRPDLALIHVAGHPTGSSFPSTFALTYGATSAIWRCWVRCGRAAGRGLRRWRPASCCWSQATAREWCWAHWPSEVAVSYLLALVWAGFLLRWVPSSSITTI